MSTPTAKKRSMSLRQNIANARKAMKSWPKWMREIARFEGYNHD